MPLTRQQQNFELDSNDEIAQKLKYIWVVESKNPYSIQDIKGNANNLVNQSETATDAIGIYGDYLTASNGGWSASVDGVSDGDWLSVYMIFRVRNIEDVSPPAPPVLLTDNSGLNITATASVLELTRGGDTITIPYTGEGESDDNWNIMVANLSSDGFSDVSINGYVSTAGSVGSGTNSGPLNTLDLQLLPMPTIQYSDVDVVLVGLGSERLHFGDSNSLNLDPFQFLKKIHKDYNVISRKIGALDLPSSLVNGQYKLKAFFDDTYERTNKNIAFGNTTLELMKNSEGNYLLPTYTFSNTDTDDILNFNGKSWDLSTDNSDYILRVTESNNDTVTKSYTLNAMPIGMNEDDYMGCANITGSITKTEYVTFGTRQIKIVTVNDIRCIGVSI